jgi:hypothetical protein
MRTIEDNDQQLATLWQSNVAAWRIPEGNGRINGKIVGEFSSKPYWSEETDLV